MEGRDHQIRETEEMCACLVPEMSPINEYPGILLYCIVAMVLVF